VKVIRAKILGFCMGVKRAVELAAANAAAGSAVFSIGPLVHNPKVIANLENRGVRVVSELPQDCRNSSVIIRAHGISPAAEEELRLKGCRIIDATCPNVKKSQLKMLELSREGYCVFLAGEAQHAEIEGVMGYALPGENPCILIGGADNAQAATQTATQTATQAAAQTAAAALYQKNKCAKTALLGQTTISEEEYSNIAAEIKKYFPDLEIVKTICAATTERQQALRELLLETDAVIVAGGRESANTRRLLAIAKESGKPCILAEDTSDIPADFYNFEKVGLCAGASTPDSLIDEIEAALQGGSQN